MLHVDARAGQFREEDVARDDHVLRDARPAGQAEHGAPVALVHDAAGGEVVVLAMVEGEEVEHAGVIERAAHDLVVLDAMAVVGERDHAGLVERADGRELLALHADGDAAGGEDVDAGRFERALAHERDGVRAVRGRVGVGHGQDAGEAARRRRARAGGDGFLLAAARFAQVDVHVDEAGRDDEALRVDDGHGGILRRGGAFGDASVDDEEIADFVPARGGIDDPSAANEKGMGKARWKEVDDGSGVTERSFLGREARIGEKCRAVGLVHFLVLLRREDAGVLNGRRPAGRRVGRIRLRPCRAVQGEGQGGEEKDLLHVPLYINKGFCTGQCHLPATCTTKKHARSFPACFCLGVRKRN
jgi:hypothetical protein